MDGQIVIKGVQPAEEFALTQAGPRSGRGWFDALFRDHYPRVVSLLARLTGDRGQAEEIAADVFCKVSQGPGPDPESDGITPWLYRVATNAGLDAVRSNARRRKREDAAGTETLRNRQEDVLGQMLRSERRARVRSILGELKPRESQLLLLRAEGLAYREVAETLGIHPGSVGTLLARAEAEFERKFRARYGDDI
jgi:RNA polymerase sigma-70 factor (ECF subfamily)